jgi:hypothetical protein
VTALSHPHNGAWLACCVETRLRQAAGDTRIRDSVLARMAESIRTAFSLPRYDPLEVSATSKFPRREKIRQLGGRQLCHTCGREKECPYLAPGAKKYDHTSKRECSVCYHLRRPATFAYR